MSVVEIQGVTRRFGETLALDGVDLRIEEGELFALLGPSGSGKTTLLRAIAGFVEPIAGTIRIDGDPMRHLPVHRRDIGMVFQHYALFPHMSVFDNVAFGLHGTASVAVRGGERGARHAGAGAARRVRGPAARTALRRAAAKSGARPRPRHPATGPAPRRAPWRARQAAAPPDAGRAQADPARGRDHDGVRHPRSGRGAHPVRPHRAPELGPAGAVRPAAGGLRTPEDGIRGRLFSARPTSSPERPAAPTGCWLRGGASS